MTANGQRLAMGWYSLLAKPGTAADLNTKDEISDKS